MDRPHDHDEDDIREVWDRLADDWQIQVGDDGDANRRLNSDPVLWAFLGDVAGRRVLDAGCGTSYLSRQLAEGGAVVTGIDASERMIALARTSSPGLDLRVDSCTTLATIEDGTFDAVVANYVVMDVPDLPATIAAFHRVLRPDGIAVLVFSHPCFPQARSSVTAGSRTVSYHWPFSYFEPRTCVDPPWKHFTSHFVYFHRPLSTYWKAFRDAGFEVVEFEEPRIEPDRYALAQSARELANCRMRPYSVAFKLQKRTR
ncbi:MAG: class I SAM-dependent methyltransferase [Vicinamibacteraceae bacterium]